MKIFIPQIEPYINEQELAYLKEAIDSTYVTEHTLTHDFEERIKELTGAKYAVAMCNGTAALFCCLKALGIGHGDEVIVPNLTFIATANAVIMAGATPVLCDVKAHDLSLDLEKARDCITVRTKAIMPVHLYGFSADILPVIRLANEFGLKVVEDAAQGVGVKRHGYHTGTFGDLGVLSFYGNKTITCGEGGVVITNSKELRDKCYQLKNHGRSSKGVFIHETVGFNFCFTEMQAAVGLAQLDKLPAIIKAKADIRYNYVNSLAELDNCLVPLQPDGDTEPVYWFTSFLTSRKDELKAFLLKEGIQTRDFFYPLDKQPCYNESNVVKGSTFEVSHKLYEQGISLPSSYSLNWGDQAMVVDAIRRFFKE